MWPASPRSRLGPRFSSALTKSRALGPIEGEPCAHSCRTLPILPKDLPGALPRKEADQGHPAASDGSRPATLRQPISMASRTSSKLQEARPGYSAGLPAHRRRDNRHFSATFLPISEITQTLSRAGLDHPWLAIRRRPDGWERGEYPLEPRNPIPRHPRLFCKTDGARPNGLVMACLDRRSRHRAQPSDRARPPPNSRPLIALPEAADFQQSMVRPPRWAAPARCAWRRCSLGGAWSPA